MIKNIFWDIDGVLANLNFAYFNFLKNHPKYQSRYANLRWEDLPKVLPINSKYGALELKTHPEMGAEMDHDFCHAPEFFTNRPLYPNVIETIKMLDQNGYRQFTLSATFDVETKKRFLNELLKDVHDVLTIECVQHGKFMHDTAKEDMLKECLNRYNLKAAETVLIDDRIYNQVAALNIGAVPLRYRSEFTTDLPKNLQFIDEVESLSGVIDWLKKQNGKLNITQN